MESLKQKNEVNAHLENIKTNFKTKIICMKPEEDLQGLAMNEVALKNFHDCEHYLYTEGTLKKRLEELKFGDDSKRVILEEIQAMKSNENLQA